MSGFNMPAKAYNLSRGEVIGYKVETITFHVHEDVIESKTETVDIMALRLVWRNGGIA